MRPPHDGNEDALRGVVLVLAVMETLVWFRYFWMAVTDGGFWTLTVVRDFAMFITVVYALTGGLALALAWRGARLRLALVLVLLPIVAVAGLTVAIAPPD